MCLSCCLPVELTMQTQVPHCESRAHMLAACCPCSPAARNDALPGLTDTHGATRTLSRLLYTDARPSIGSVWRTIMVMHQTGKLHWLHWLHDRRPDEKSSGRSVALRSCSLTVATESILPFYPLRPSQSCLPGPLSASFRLESGHQKLALSHSTICFQPVRYTAKSRHTISV